MELWRYNWHSENSIPVIESQAKNATMWYFLMGGGFGDLIFFYFFIKTAAADAQLQGSPFLVPFAFFQGLYQQTAFIGCNGPGGSDLCFGKRLL